MIDFSLFTLAHLAAAEDRYAAEFEEAASKGMLGVATSTHRALEAVQAEIKRREAAA